MIKKINSLKRPHKICVFGFFLIFLVLLIFFGVKPILADLPYSEIVLEKTIQIEVWANTSIEIIEEQGFIKAQLFLDNGTIVVNQEIHSFLDENKISIDITNSENYILPFSNFSELDSGNYSFRAEFFGSPQDYLNPSSKEKQIEIIDENGEKRIIIFEDFKTEIETNITEINETIENISLEGFDCMKFKENVLWSSGYSSKQEGSVEYYSWQPNHTCEEIHGFGCVLINIEVKSRVITSAQEEIDFTGEGFVQISEPNELICNNPEQGFYERYLFYETSKDGEDKLNIQCGKSKNPDEKCAVEIVGNYSGELSCYGIKTQASRYSIVDVFEIKYDLCRRVDGWFIKK